MLACIFPRCEGHGARRYEAILHSLEHLAAEVAEIKADQATIITKEGTIMTDVATVAADFDKYKTDVAAAFARLQASIDAGNADAQALADLDAAINGADADANAEDPAPVVTPDPTAGDGTVTE